MALHQAKSNSPFDVIHKYYMDIINSVPDAIYWIDMDCNLMGYNQPFINLLGISNPEQLKNSPYILMQQHARWPKERTENLRLDDMKTLFTGLPSYNVEEKAIITDKNNVFYFKATRVPLRDEKQQLGGLVVILTDISDWVALKKEQHSPKKHPIQSTTQEQKPPKVLMIEDNLIAQNVESALLSALNCQVDIADTGSRALELFEPGKYDLVLMDIGLTDTSGYVVAKNLRKQEKNTPYHVPIIALTGYEADIVKYDCEQYFMEGVITKPLSTEQAKQLIQHYVYHQDTEITGLKSM